MNISSSCLDPALVQKTATLPVCRSVSTPPDLILIPDRFKSAPIDSLYRARGFKGRTNRYLARLKNVLRDAGVRSLGDLDGKRLSDFEQRRACGAVTVIALRTMLLKALYPGVRKRSGMRPIRMRDHKALPPVIEVGEFCRGLRLDELPMSVGLEGGFRARGVKRLGRLHGVPIRELLARANWGRKTVNELQTLVLRANGGEFSISAAERAAICPADLLRQIDRLVLGLRSRDRSFVTLRFGAKDGRERTCAGSVGGIG